MRRFLSLFTMLMLCGVLAFAQSRVVTGKVTDIDGNPVSFASVKVKGTNTGVSADANGAYSLKVNPGAVLVISGASFKETEVPVGTQNFLSTVMEKGSKNELTEVVVTSAFGIKRAARSASSNVQNLTGDQVNTIRQTNVNNALAGKVAGAQVRSQSVAKLGAESVVRLRGENGLGVGGGALYVVDGTIMPSGADIN
ncbi:MAG: carboxypeptidase-like regulatory domain-containing protein, partial [Ferruginibacter sp.]